MIGIIADCLGLPGRPTLFKPDSAMENACWGQENNGFSAAVAAAGRPKLY